MNPSIHSCNIYGEEAFRANNGILEMTVVPGWGGNCLSLRYMDKDLELLKTPDSASEYEQLPFIYGIPVLFPPNRIADGEFTYNGRTYRFPINEHAERNHSHGLVYDKKWKMTDSRADGTLVMLEMTINTREHPDILTCFPHAFELRIRYTLTGASLLQETRIVNEGTDPMPWGIGFHTTFRLPIRPGAAPEGGTFSLPAAVRWELDERFLPTGRLTEVDIDRWSQGFDLYGLPLDDLFSVHPEHPNQAILTDPETGLRIVYRCDERLEHWVVYNADGRQGYVCPEPYTWVTNAPNLNLPREKTGFAVLEPGGTVTLRTEIRVEEMGQR